MEELKVKQLEWKMVKPEVYEDFSYNAKVYNLYLNQDNAYYQINSVNHNIGTQFWVGNRAFKVEGNYKYIDEAKKVCQEHYEEMILANLIPDKSKETL